MQVSQPDKFSFDATTITDRILLCMTWQELHHHAVGLDKKSRDNVGAERERKEAMAIGVQRTLASGINYDDYRRWVEQEFGPADALGTPHHHMTQCVLVPLWKRKEAERLRELAEARARELAYMLSPDAVRDVADAFGAGYALSFVLAQTRSSASHCEDVECAESQRWLCAHLAHRAGADDYRTWQKSAGADVTYEDAVAQFERARAEARVDAAVVASTVFSDNAECSVPMIPHAQYLLAVSARTKEALDAGKTVRHVLSGLIPAPGIVDLAIKAWDAYMGRQRLGDRAAGALVATVNRVLGANTFNVSARGRITGPSGRTSMMIDAARAKMCAREVRHEEIGTWADGAHVWLDAGPLAVALLLASEPTVWARRHALK